MTDSLERKSPIKRKLVSFTSEVLQPPPSIRLPERWLNTLAGRLEEKGWG